MAIRDETSVRTAWAYSKSTEDLASTTPTTNNNPPFNNKHPTPYKHHHRFAQQQARNTTVVAQGGGGTQPASGHQQPEYENLLEVRPPLQKPSAAALMNESKRKFTRQADWRQLKRINAAEYKDRLVP